MLKNNETESENIGWAVRSSESPHYNKILEVTGWETISNQTRMKEITVRTLDMRKHHSSAVAPVIHASSINGNQTFSIVSKIFNDHAKQIIITRYITYTVQFFTQFRKTLEHHSAKIISF